MARKKRQEESSAGSPWLNTFADLMNLLLCFFVLLFASSTVDAAKYEDIVISMSSAFGIFDGAGTNSEEGRMITSGISKQQDDLKGNDNFKGSSNVKLEKDDSMKADALKELLEENKEASQAIYDKVSELTEKNSLNHYVELSMDPGYQYVRISLSGSILFDSGKADIKPDAELIFSKLGDILQVYKNYEIEIEGHTDNVPVNRNNTYIDNNWLSSARALNVATYLMEKKGLNPKMLSWTGRGEYDPVASNATPEGRAKNRRVEIKIHNNINN